MGRFLTFQAHNQLFRLGNPSSLGFDDFIG